MNIISLFVASFSLVSALVYNFLPQNLRIPFLSLISITFMGLYSPVAAGIILIECFCFFTVVKKQAALVGLKRKICLWALILTAVMVLMLVKYIIPAPGTSTFFATLDVSQTAITLGASYFVLRLISYAVDVYRSQCTPANDFLSFVLYTLFFPALLQGPIERYSTFCDKISASPKRTLSYDNVRNSGICVLKGLFKVTIISAFCANFTPILNSAQGYNGGFLILVAFLYTIQIYAEFSGGIDIVRGISYLFGIELTDNFNTPYFSQSFSEFWKRWHITFSGWLRDYIYIPLGGSKHGVSRKYINLILVFLISGLWHNITLPFLIWGALQALFQIVEDLLPHAKRPVQHIEIPLTKYLLRSVLTIVLVTFSWLFFNAASMRSLADYFTAVWYSFTHIASFGQFIVELKNEVPHLCTTVSAPACLRGLIFLCIFVLLEFLRDRYGFTLYDKKRNVVIRWLFYAAVIFCLITFNYTGTRSAADFVYGGF